MIKGLVCRSCGKTFIFPAVKPGSEGDMIEIYCDECFAECNNSKITKKDAEKMQQDFKNERRI